MNAADSDCLADALAARGYTAAESPAGADLLIVNTCSVRAHAETRAKARIAEYARKKASAGRPQMLWVIGCMAERLGESLRAEIPGIDRVIGAQQLEYISQELDSMLDGQAPAHSREESPAAAPVSAFLPIMRGCDNYCSYCVVPYVRGREHSIPAHALCRQAQDLARRGAREITLLGQNVNSYRDNAVDFADLLRALHAIDGIERIRFTTSHPKDCSEKLIRTVAELPKLCKHFHLPVQSGSTRILQAMNRNYSRESYLRLIDAIRTAVPDADITTDVMVGFPGETDDDFAQTMSLFERVRFTTAFMFAYSAREETAAARLADRVPEHVKKQRLERIIALETAITKEIYAGMVGSTAHVLITGRQNRRGTAWVGQDNGCKRVLMRCGGEPAGTILPVKVVRSTGMTLIAERTA